VVAHDRVSRWSVALTNWPGVTVDNRRVVAPANWPDSWVGTWVALDFKTVVISRVMQGITVTVSPAPGQQPYTSAPLLDNHTEAIENLPATCRIDQKGRRYLELEAGTPGCGPTYRLYATVEEALGHRPADDDVPAQHLVLVPDTGMGLYDDWEDDLGVPWAHPLGPLKWQPGP